MTRLEIINQLIEAGLSKKEIIIELVNQKVIQGKVTHFNGQTNVYRIADSTGKRHSVNLEKIDVVKTI
jgi:small nuclear ribonucleoprotein (snRNP)-like protein